MYPPHFLFISLSLSLSTSLSLTHSPFPTLPLSILSSLSLTSLSLSLSHLTTHFISPPLSPTSTPCSLYPSLPLYLPTYSPISLFNSLSPIPYLTTHYHTLSSSLVPSFPLFLSHTHTLPLPPLPLPISPFTFLPAPPLYLFTSLSLSLSNALYYPIHLSLYIPVYLYLPLVDDDVCQQYLAKKVFPVSPSDFSITSTTSCVLSLSCCYTFKERLQIPRHSGMLKIYYMYWLMNVHDRQSAYFIGFDTV
jgi:hypothetical protein